MFLSVSIATISNFLQICTLWRYNYETSQPKSVSVQGNHQNWVPSLLPYKCWLIFIGMKQKKFQMADSKKLRFSTPPILKTFLRKFLGIGPWVSRINRCEGHWCGSTYIVVRLSDVRSKTGKKCIQQSSI